ncbi:MAG: hypothetical protein Q7S39_07590, partial [Ignavibacteria bacterium]|nr:hypothetical protein [Ignavibacteria bacterium]
IRSYFSGGIAIPTMVLDSSGALPNGGFFTLIKGGLTNFLGNVKSLLRVTCRVDGKVEVDSAVFSIAAELAPTEKQSTITVGQKANSKVVKDSSGIIASASKKKDLGFFKIGLFVLVLVAGFSGLFNPIITMAQGTQPIRNLSTITQVEAQYTRPDTAVVTSTSVGIINNKSSSKDTSAVAKDPEAMKPAAFEVSCGSIPEGKQGEFREYVINQLNQLSEDIQQRLIGKRGLRKEDVKFLKDKGYQFIGDTPVISVTGFANFKKSIFPESKELRVSYVFVNHKPIYFVDAASQQEVIKERQKEHEESEARSRKFNTVLLSIGISLVGGLLVMLLGVTLYEKINGREARQKRYQKILSDPKKKLKITDASFTSKEDHLDVVISGRYRAVLSQGNIELYKIDRKDGQDRRLFQISNREPEYNQAEDKIIDVAAEYLFKDKPKEKEVFVRLKNKLDPKDKYLASAFLDFVLRYKIEDISDADVVFYSSLTGNSIQLKDMPDTDRKQFIDELIIKGLKIKSRYIYDRIVSYIRWSVENDPSSLLWLFDSFKNISDKEQLSILEDIVENRISGLKNKKEFFSQYYEEILKMINPALLPYKEPVNRMLADRVIADNFGYLILKGSFNTIFEQMPDIDINRFIVEVLKTDTLKTDTNKSKIKEIFSYIVGSEEALKAIKSDEQLTNEFIDVLSNQYYAEREFQNNLKMLLEVFQPDIAGFSDKIVKIFGELGKLSFLIEPILKGKFNQVFLKFKDSLELFDSYKFTAEFFGDEEIDIKIKKSFISKCGKEYKNEYLIRNEGALKAIASNTELTDDFIKMLRNNEVDVFQKNLNMLLEIFQPDIASFSDKIAQIFSESGSPKFLIYTILKGRLNQFFLRFKDSPELLGSSESLANRRKEERKSNPDIYNFIEYVLNQESLRGDFRKEFLGQVSAGLVAKALKINIKLARYLKDRVDDYNISARLSDPDFRAKINEIAYNL